MNDPVRQFKGTIQFFLSKFCCLMGSAAGFSCEVPNTVVVRYWLKLVKAGHVSLDQAWGLASLELLITWAI